MDSSEIFFNNANSRETYFTLHHIKEAHQYSKGLHVKVGILDWLFGKEIHKDLYSDFIDVTNTPNDILNYEGHGYWMASVLKEIAPECEIYAINCVFYNENNKNLEDHRILYLEKAVDWAIENKIDILTYSHKRFESNYNEKLTSILNRANQNHIITTFIHCDHKDNLWPYGCMPFINNEGFSRNPDYNILHYDYNQLFIQSYNRYKEAVENKAYIKSGDMVPYFSFSSMSPVLAGFVSILLGIKGELTLEKSEIYLIKLPIESQNRGKIGMTLIHVKK